MDCDIGVIGLATMGANLARNAARKGFGVALYNRHEDKMRGVIEKFGDEGRFVAATSLKELVAALAKPRRVVIMVAAGEAVDAVIDELTELLETDDIIIDAGNSLFTDTNRRTAAAKEKGLRFIGMGVSGGEEGALLGPSMMPGGDAEAYRHLEPIVTKMAAQVGDEPCCTFIGADGAGHYVKMVHNGIEYADMQIIAETYDLLRSVYGLRASEIADIFDQWKDGDLESYLVEITATVLRQQDEGGTPLVDHILDEASQKGTGRWTARNALDLGVPLTGITEAVHARVLSAQKSLRTTVAKRIPPAAVEPVAIGQEQIDDLRDALYASKIIAYAQGFEQMTAAAKEYGWTLDLGDIATIWRGGCIIRAKFLDRIRDAYLADPKLQTLLLNDYFADALLKAEPAWRRVVALATGSGTPIPAFSSSLSYFDGLRREAGPANLIQGLRDLFGAHTYHRTDREGVFHTQWNT